MVLFFQAVIQIENHVILLVITQVDVYTIHAMKQNMDLVVIQLMEIVMVLR